MIHFRKSIKLVNLLIGVLGISVVMSADVAAFELIHKFEALPGKPIRSCRQIVLGADGYLYGGMSYENAFLRIDRDGGDLSFPAAGLVGGTETFGLGGPKLGSDGFYYYTGASTSSIRVYRTTFPPADTENVMLGPYNGGTQAPDDGGLVEVSPVSWVGVSGFGGLGPIANAKGFLYRLNVGGFAGFLHTFSGTDGDWPQRPPILGADGYLYGTTTRGGSGNSGVIYRIHPNGSEFSVLHHFVAATDGAYPRGLIQLDDGRLVGGTHQGGPTFYGTVFSIRPDGSDWRVLHGLDPQREGASVAGPLLDRGKGWLYGLMGSHGPLNTGGIFRLRDDGSEMQILHHFGAADQTSSATGALIDGENGYLYGTSVYGYEDGKQTNTGSLFRIKLPPTFLDGATTTAKAGEAFSFRAVPDNSADGFSAEGLPEGLRIDATTGIISGVPVRAGTYAVVVTAQSATGYDRMELDLTLEPSDQAITFLPPADVAFPAEPILLEATVDGGAPVELRVVSGPGNLDENRLEILGVGVIEVQATAAAQPGLTTAAELTRRIEVRPGDSRLLNMSVRARLDATRSLITGFVVEDGEGDLLIRGVGPSLAGYVGTETAVVNDPRLSVFDAGAALVMENDNWADGDALRSAMASVGAFALAGGSADAVLALAVSGLRTVHIAGDVSGLGLVELYRLPTGSGQLVNLSVRYQVQASVDVLVAGFVLEGSNAARVVIRGVGPRLGELGVTGALPDPSIRLFDAGGNTVEINHDWSESATESMARVGAFALSPGSKDAVIVTDLAPGLYTVVLDDSSGAAGEGMIEIYLDRFGQAQP